MTKQFLILFFSCFLVHFSIAQSFTTQTPYALHWADSVANTLNIDQKIAQLMIVRAHSNLGQVHIDEVTNLIKKYNVGGLCFFQGGPVRQAILTNYYQSIATTPLMIAIDGEWGLGMRLDSVINFPKQLMMGAMPDAKLVYQVGKAIGEQCKRLGIQINFAPDVDINNNPDNPVINDRSFGEDKYKVALFGTAYTKGMQEVGVMACAKHFPGHGDVAVDSHLDLPIINKTKAQLDSVELYPFKALIKAGVGSIMNAHLFIPAIDSTTNQATSLSIKNVNNLLKQELAFTGLTFTDALEMKGITKYFPAGEAAVQSLIAGNDMLCLPADVAISIEKIKEAIRQGRISETAINQKLKKVLLSKYHLGLKAVTPIVLDNIINDLNENTNNIKQQICQQAITVLKLNNNKLLPLPSKKKIIYLGVGINQSNTFATALQKKYHTTILTLDYKDSSSINTLLKKFQHTNKTIVIGLHNYSRKPANNFGLSKQAVTLIQSLQHNNNAILFAFGNPYAIKNFCEFKNVVACYEDDSIMQQTAINLLCGKSSAIGKLPVTVCSTLTYGLGSTTKSYFNYTSPTTVGFNNYKLNAIDTIVQEAIFNNAMPGCVVLVAKNGKIVFHKAYGYTNFDKQKEVTLNMVYDLASVTKISATTLAIMKLYDEKKINLNHKLSDYLSDTKGTDKANLKIKDILWHQAGFIPFITFYKPLLDKNGNPQREYFSTQNDGLFTTKVAEDLYLRKDYQDTLMQRIIESKLSAPNQYVYSDINFIILGKIVETLTHQSLDQFVTQQFYKPMQLSTTTFLPKEHYPTLSIAPTELDTYFRKQLLQGDVHDESAAIMGGVAGNAGLFSNAYDLATLFQMLLNKGTMNGVQYLQPSTIKKFTTYQSNKSRRALGFDKPEKNNTTQKIPYPSKYVSATTYGHTGFTGTCVWVDPAKKLIYIFLSNRVTPTRNNNKLSELRVRANIQDAIYKAIN